MEEFLVQASTGPDTNGEGAPLLEQLPHGLAGGLPRHPTAHPLTAINLFCLTLSSNCLLLGIVQCGCQPTKMFIGVLVMSISEGIALVPAQYRGAVEDEPFSSGFFAVKIQWR